MASLSIFDELIDKVKPDILVIENYRVYPWLLKQHAWADIPTLRYIGALQHVAALRNIPVKLQMAQLAKTFSPNSRLRLWGLLNEGNKHANDAIRHGVYYLLFAK